MPVLKTELKISTENRFSAYTIQVLQVNLSMMVLKKWLQDQKKNLSVATQNTPADSLQIFAIQREI